jgi:hypothetical protein
MRPVHASLYDVDCGDQSPEDVVLALTDLVEKWIVGKYRQRTNDWGAAELSFPEDGTATAPLPGHELSGRLTTGDGFVLRGLQWRHPDESDADVAWVSRVAISAVEDQVQFHCTVHIDAQHQSLRPIGRPVGRPKLITSVLSAFRTQVDGWPVSRSVRKLAREQVTDFVESVLTNPARRLPVVVISLDGWSERPLVDPAEVQRALVGLAEVVVFDDKFVAFDLTDEVGKVLACYDGAARVYWPGLRIPSSSSRHPLFLSSKLKEFKERGSSWASHLSNMFQRIGLQAFAVSPLANKARRLVAEAERMSERDVAELAKTGSVSVGDLMEALEKSWDREQQDKEEIEKLHAQVEQLQYSLSFRDVDVETADELDASSGATRGFASVLEAVQAASSEFEGKLVFLPSALKSAEKSPFDRPDDVYMMLRSMARVVERWQKGEGALGSRWEDAVGEHGYEFKTGISQTTRTKWGAEYTFNYEGQSFLFQQHITLGAKAADTCLSAHFHRDDDRLILVVGWCGRHLRNTNT